MRAKEFIIKKIFENQNEVMDNLDNFKTIISSKIKDLPPTTQSKNILDEINDLLEVIPLGGKKASLSGQLEKWKDEDVKAAKNDLAKYIVGLSADYAFKKAMLDKWKTSGLINVSLLIDGSHTINEIVMDYDTNPAIAELANDLLQVATLGHGKGEFMLKVMSPQISSPGSSGDLLIRGLGTLEVKTNDRGEPRFTDRQVKPGASFRPLSQKFIETYAQYLSPVTTEVDNIQSLSTQTSATQYQNDNKALPLAEKMAKIKANPKVSSSGINISQLIVIYKNCPLKEKQEFINDLTKILDQIFIKVPGYSKAIVNAITSGNVGQAKQLYGAGILENYIAFKKDIGVLYIDLTSQVPIFIFFKDSNSLYQAGMRIHTKVIYPVSDSEENAYPQMKIVQTIQDQPAV